MVGTDLHIIHLMILSTTKVGLYTKPVHYWGESVPSWRRILIPHMNEIHRREMQDQWTIPIVAGTLSILHVEIQQQDTKILCWLCTSVPCLLLFRHFSTRFSTLHFLGFTRKHLLGCETAQQDASLLIHPRIF